MKPAQASKKTDNKHFFSKILLREYFLEKYHKSEIPRVLDCCAGYARIWNHLSKSRKIKYVGLDEKRERGRLKTDSKNIFTDTGWDYDIIDIDTYGSPFGHYLPMLKTFCGNALTVFLTIGKQKQRANIPKDALSAMGITSKLPAVIQFYLFEFSVKYCLTRCYEYNIIPVECKEAFPQTNARYVGIRLERG